MKNETLENPLKTEVHLGVELTVFWKSRLKRTEPESSDVIPYVKKIAEMKQHTGRGSLLGNRKSFWTKIVIL